MIHSNPAFHSFETITRRLVTRAATPAILMTKRVYDGFRVSSPNAPSIQQGWLAPVTLSIPEYTDATYGMDVIFTAFRE